MPLYKYKVLDKEMYRSEGLIEAVNENVAADLLKDKGFSIISITKKSRKRPSEGIVFLHRVSAKDIVVFARQFSVMISANVSVVQALKILIDQTPNPKLKKNISEIAAEVDAGARLSDTLARRSKIFSNFFVSVIRSGETSGKLDEVLDYLADEMEQDYDMTRKIRGAMIYPTFIFSGLLIVGALMMIFVVPKLTSIIIESGADIPLPTKILITISGFLTSFWWLLIIFIIVATLTIRYYINTATGRRMLDKFKLKIPIFSRLFQLIYIVRFTRSMHTLLVGGVTIGKSLEVASDVVSNTVYKDLIERTLEDVEAGNSISSVFEESKEIPQMVSQMMSVGEKTGKLDLVLDKITHFYSREINNMVANLMTLMEPVVLVVMGVAVAIMVSAIILPMYNLASQF